MPKRHKNRTKKGGFLDNLSNTLSGLWPKKNATGSPPSNPDSYPPPNTSYPPPPTTSTVGGRNKKGRRTRKTRRTRRIRRH